VKNIDLSRKKKITFCPETKKKTGDVSQGANWAPSFFHQREIKKTPLLMKLLARVAHGGKRLPREEKSLLLVVRLLR